MPFPRRLANAARARQFEAEHQILGPTDGDWWLARVLVQLNIAAARARRDRDWKREAAVEEALRIVRRLRRLIEAEEVPCPF